MPELDDAAPAKCPLACCRGLHLEFCFTTGDRQFLSNLNVNCPHLTSQFPLWVAMQINDCGRLYNPQHLLTAPSALLPRSSSGLQFVPLPHSSLFKMTFLHFMANQLFCFTRSASSASPTCPSTRQWGKKERKRTTGGGGGTNSTTRWHIQRDANKSQELRSWGGWRGEWTEEGRDIKQVDACSMRERAQEHHETEWRQRGS